MATSNRPGKAEANNKRKPAPGPGHIQGAAEPAQPRPHPGDSALSPRLRKDRPAAGDDAGRTPNRPRGGKTAELIAQSFRIRIMRGELREGDTLPPLALAMADLGISRPTLREAFRVLESEGLISVPRGSRHGAIVHQPRVEDAARYAAFVLQAQGTTVADIYEARLAIEPFIARKMAESPAPAAIARLRAEILCLYRMVDDHHFTDVMTTLAEFHRIFVEVSGFATLAFLNQMLQAILARYQVRFFAANVVPDDDYLHRVRAGIRSFERLLELIESGDGPKAEAHWRLHLINANAAWVPEGHEAKIIDAFD